MRPFIRIACGIALLLLSADAARAQIYGGFGYRQGAYFQVRTGPYGMMSYRAGAYYSFGPVYGVPNWYYGWPGIPVVTNPIYILPQQPPVVINNIINAPGAVAPARGAIPAEFGPAPMPPPAAKPPVKPPAGGPAILPDFPKAKPLGRADADRIVEAGRRAFADEQHGRALELFQRALAIVPDEPSTHFLVSQAYFALGKYREAVTAIAAGVEMRPDWSAARFVARDLYWKVPAGFDEHLKSLRQSVEAFPNDANLSFLLAHQLWFDGKRDEARALITKARALSKDGPAHKFAID